MRKAVSMTEAVPVARTYERSGLARMPVKPADRIQDSTLAASAAGAPNRAA